MKGLATLLRKHRACKKRAAPISTYRLKPPLLSSWRHGSSSRARNPTKLAKKNERETRNSETVVRLTPCCIRRRLDLAFITVVRVPMLRSSSRLLPFAGSSKVGRRVPLRLRRTLGRAAMGTAAATAAAAAAASEEAAAAAAAAATTAAAAA